MSKVTMAKTLRQEEGVYNRVSKILRPNVGFMLKLTVLYFIGIVAADILNDKVVPWFQEDGVRLLRILTDEKPSIVEIESTMNSNCSLLWKIDHSKTKARYPTAQRNLRKISPNHSRRILCDRFQEEGIQFN